MVEFKWKQEGRGERQKGWKDTSKTLNKKIQMDLFIGLKKTNKNDINNDIFLKL